MTHESTAIDDGDDRRHPFEVSLDQLITQLLRR